MKSPADFPTIREACSPLSGYGAGDARFTNLTSTKVSGPVTARTRGR